jgi:hypothetical protein
LSEVVKSMAEKEAGGGRVSQSRADNRFIAESCKYRMHTHKTLYIVFEGVVDG